ncbi:uncharacterized protein BDZ83DRAFT_209946 [Colletotrichum acutatum]|uniref:Maltose/galactoside acetyltransferase domain-containing protein n=1 Tax=Glomerella acutata TaxID=27357 RepID=A0AAD8UR09_GLOAC|nr:uncharacterized protein BDZ83DRAFT_209946 [Colletotrichum acutatum]KAK1727282.1 hypothetical protein BDZ83DRAFT_209946 [Colletotrichum acutatum]
MLILQDVAMDIRTIDKEENRRRMRNGELYWAFTPDLIADRKRCKAACDKLNNAGDVSRRTLVGMWKDINRDTIPLPPPRLRHHEDDALLEDYPWIDTPIKMDYGYNVKLGENVYVNSNSTWIDTCLITVGDRTLIGPNCSSAHIRWNPVSATAPAGQNRVSQSPSVRTAGSAATSSCCPGSPSARA